MCLIPSRVNSLTNYTHSEAFEDDLIVAPLVEDASALSDGPMWCESKRSRWTRLKFAGRLVAHDGRTAGVAINFILPENPDQAVVEITDYLNSVLAEARANHPDIDYYMTGDVVMHRAFADVTKSDMETLTPIVFSDHRRCHHYSPAFDSQYVSHCRRAGVCRQYDLGIRRLEWRGVQPDQCWGADHCHGDRHRGFDSHCHECFTGYAARSG